MAPIPVFLLFLEKRYLVPYRTMMELTEGNIPNYYREANKIYDAMRDDDVTIGVNAFNTIITHK